MADLAPVRADGWRGVAAAWAEAGVRRALLPDPAAAARQGTPVHENLYRAAARVEAGAAGPLLVKVHRPHGLADLLRAAVRRSRAAAEFDAARLLCGAGLPTAEPVALLERRRGLLVAESCTAARFLPRRETFEPALRAQPPSKARALLVRVARWVRAFHDRGASHGDLHSGNVLVGAGPGDRATIDVVDLHTVRSGRAVSPRRRAAQLARWLHSLRDAIGPGGRARSLAAYLGPDAPRPARRRLAARVARGIARLERRRIRSRARRCLLDSGSFTRAVGAGRGVRRRDVPVASIDAALAAHDRAIVERGPSLLKAGPKSTVTRHAGIVVKERRATGWSRRLEDLLLPARARRGYEHAHALEVRGIPTAAPLAFVRRGGRTFTLVRDLAPLPRLDHRVREALRRGDWSRRRVRELSDALADLTARLHRQGVLHGDWKAVNLLLDERGRRPVFPVVDTDRMRFVGRVSRARRSRALAQLSASLPRAVSAAERLRWLRRYARSGGVYADRAGERGFVRRVAALVARKLVVVDEPIE